MNQQLWEHLLKQAIIGTENGFTLPKAEGALAQLLPQLASRSHEEQFLHSLAILNQYFQNGRCPIQIKPNPLPACEKEDLPLCNAPSIAYLKTILSDSTQRSPLLLEWLRLATLYKKRAPLGLLATLLEKGKSFPAIHPYLPSCIGKRGQWLAALNSDWQYLPALKKESVPAEFTLDKTLWEEGRFQDRLALLEQCRRIQPEKVGELLTASWKQEDAQHRKKFLETFSIGLNLSDEPFLKTCLSDRSSLVQETAIQLLGNRSEFQFTQHWLKALSTCISVETKSKEAKLKITLPEQFLPEWDTLGLREKIPANSTLSGIAPESQYKNPPHYWFYQMLKMVRPSLFAQHLKLKPVEWYSLCKKGEFKSILSVALKESVQFFKDQDIAEIIIQESKQDEFFNELYNYFEIFSSAQMESLLKQRLHSYGDKLHSRLDSDGYPILRTFTYFKEECTLEFSRLLLNDFLLPILENDKQRVYYIYEYLKQLPSVLKSDLYPEIETAFKALKPSKEEAYQESRQKYIDEFLNQLQFRYQMKKELSA